MNALNTNAQANDTTEIEIVELDSNELMAIGGGADAMAGY
jgi:hypothetical protein